MLPFTGPFEAWVETGRSKIAQVRHGRRVGEVPPKPKESEEAPAPVAHADPADPGAPDAEVEPPLQPITPGVRQRQIGRLGRVRARRSEEEVARCLAALEEAVQEPEANILDPMFECVKAYTTLGEISGCLERLWGRYREPSF